MLHVVVSTAHKQVGQLLEYLPHKHIFAFLERPRLARDTLWSKGADVNAIARYDESAIKVLWGAVYPLHHACSRCCGARCIHCTMRAQMADSRTSQVSCASATWR
jgi:hypothetical protein